MPQGNGAQTHAVLDKFIAIHVPDMAALSLNEKAGRHFRVLVIPFGIGMGATGDEGVAL